MSRRQALGRMSAVAGVGAAAWVVPEILVAKPAAGATLSGSGTGPTSGGGVSTSPGTTGTTGTSGTNGTNGTAATDGVTSGATLSPSPTLAFTGLDIQRDAEIGAALIAGGWAMQHWASRARKLAADGPTEVPEAGGAGDPT
jgi:hypothetical protein